MRGILHVLDERGDADDYFRTELRFEGGLDATVEMSGFSYLRPMRWEILGERGTLQLIGNIHGEFALTIACAGAEPKTVTTTAQAESARRGDGGLRLYQALVDHIQGRGPLAVTPDHALRVTRLLDAIRRSAEIEGGSVRP